MKQRVLVIGDGDDAYKAAMSAAQVGLEVLIIGQKPFDVMNNKITFKDKWLLKRLMGQIGDFHVVFETPDGLKQEIFSAIITAIGADKKPCSLIKYAGNKAVTFSTMVSRLDTEQDKPSGNVVFIQDIDEDDGQWISAMGIEIARKVRHYWGNDVYYLCRFIRGSHFNVEDAYRRAREEGVIFIKYKKNSLTIESSNTNVRVIFNDHYQDLAIDADLVVMSETLIPKKQTAQLAAMFRIGLNPEGFFQYDNAYYPSTITNRRGIYILGACKGSSGLNDVDGDAQYTALDIKRQLIDLKPIADIRAIVDPFKCSLCLTCMRLCPHGALHISDNMPAIAVYDMACQGCGICTAACPANAINLSYDNKAIITAIECKKKLKVYCCENSAKRVLDKLGWQDQLFNDIELVLKPCSGNIEQKELINDLNAGFKRILILACYNDACKHVNGNMNMHRQVKALQNMLEVIGISKDSIQIVNVAASSSIDVISNIKAAYNKALEEIAL